MNDDDAVVIVVGAGNAGLTAAATVQRAGARTLLLQRHNAAEPTARCTVPTPAPTNEPRRCRMPAAEGARTIPDM
ncbi:FAD-dependent monooxygenase [Nocardia sp. NPDC051990]|uniref:FAD-dependent monooxygenase n=1 Tax=Nocardia sp. NPDC051990 TaxID=3155285 RepID=UPI00342BC4B3